MSCNLFEERPKKSVERRNALIVELRREGLTYKEIAQRVDLTRERVRQLLKQAERAARQNQELEAIAVETRSSNDLTRKWPCFYLINAMGFPRRAIIILTKYFSDAGVQELSLVDLLDLLLPHEYAPHDLYLVDIPALQIKFMGSTTFVSVINRVGKLDLGDAFTNEVKTRKAKLLQVLVRHGNYYFYLIDQIEWSLQL